MRIALISIFLAPYLYYGYQDHRSHFRGRKVPPAEHLLHLFVGITMTVAIANAFRGRLIAFVASLCLFLVIGAIDEYIYHRGLPEHESDLHAKQHMALLMFVVVCVASIWLGEHHWQLPNIH
ncbi:MAG TPA: hypothetical protein VFE47_21690 [Tepidisphaeraceae bacterium]|jgi:hypothetical protein|nr:hypothetical protein [Tepidisphaeraceae bacterium]